MGRRDQFRFGFWLVFRREIGWLRRRPFLLFMTTLGPLALMLVLSVIFSPGLATRLPIGVLDLDGSDLSRTIIRAVNATPDAAITERVADLNAGRQMILEGRIHGLLMLPLNLERDVLTGRRPEVVFFYNTQTLTTGNLVLRGVSAAVPTVAAGIRIAVRTAQGQSSDIAQGSLQPIPVQVNPLFNPTLNYAFFLLAALLPSVLQIVITTTSAYSVGLDAETRHRLRVLRRLGNGLWPAMAGKILPYTLIFLVILGLSDLVLFGLLQMPLNGSRLLLLGAGLLFILACQLAGALLALLLGSAGALSLGTLVTAPAFGFMGVGFPRLAMNAFAYWWGALLPGTWYLMVRVDQTLRGTPVDYGLYPLLILAVFVVVLLALIAGYLEFLRMRAAARSARPASGEVAA